MNRRRENNIEATMIFIYFQEVTTKRILIIVLLRYVIGNLFLEKWPSVNLELDSRQVATLIINIYYQKKIPLCGAKAADNLKYFDSCGEEKTAI